MTDKERLHDIIWNGLGTEKFLHKDISWLIEQAEKVQELEKELNKVRTKLGVKNRTIKKKQHVINTIDHHNNRLQNDNNAKTIVLERFRAKNKKLSEALEFYADDSNYSQDPENPILNDSGKLASKVLEELK